MRNECRPEFLFVLGDLTTVRGGGGIHVVVGGGWIVMFLPRYLLLVLLSWGVLGAVWLREDAGHRTGETPFCTAVCTVCENIYFPRVHIFGPFKNTNGHIFTW